MTTAQEDTPLYGSMGLDRDDSSASSGGSSSHDKRLQRERAESILLARIHQLREREERDDSSIWAPCRGGHGGTTTTGRTKSIALVLLTVLSAAVIMSLYVWIPSAADVRAAQDFNIPILGASRKVQNAQDMADRYRDSYLDDDDDNKSSSSGKKRRHKIDNNKSQEGPDAPPEGCEATVMLIRHCEKGMVREHCSYVGYERSVYLATLFGSSNDTHNSRWPAPSYIYAQSPAGRHNPKKMIFREYETVAPLAQKLGLDVNEQYGTKSSHKMVREVLRLLQSGEACGKLVLISWKHSDIGHLAHRLGCGPEQGCPLDYRGKTFDEAWQIKFVYDRFRHSTKRDLQLPASAEWKVFGSVQNEGFDPLAFSKIVGDYPPGGTAATPTGGAANWKGELVQVPERKYVDDRKTWERAKRHQERTVRHDRA